MIFTKAVYANSFSVTVKDKNNKQTVVVLSVSDYATAETKAKLLLDAALSEEIISIVANNKIITDVTV